jgi:hypothetical protein
MLFFRGRKEQESRQDCAAEVHALQGDLRGRVGSHVPRPERAFTQHLHARREQTGKIEHICKKIITKCYKKAALSGKKFALF